jgi:tetratricopeptide (TPR) repeat protein
MTSREPSRTRQADRRSGARRWLLLALLLQLPVASRADSPRERAAQLLRAGNQLHDRGDYPGALQKYREAKNLYPSFKIDFNIGITLDAMGRSIEAAELLDRFLRRAASAADPAIVSAARRRLEGLRHRLASLSVRCALRGATVAVNRAPVGQTPLDGPIFVQPGAHRLEVRADGHEPFDSTFTLERGTDREIVVALRALALAPLQPLPPARPPATPIYKRWWFWTVIGVVVAGGVTGAVVATQRGEGSSRVPAGELGTIP